MKILVVARQRKPSKKEQKELLGIFQYVFFIFPEKNHERIWVITNGTTPEFPQFSLELVMFFNFRQRETNGTQIFTRRSEMGKGTEIAFQTFFNMERASNFVLKTPEV